MKNPFKIFIVFCLAIAIFVGVFNTKDRLNYDDLQYVADSIKAVSDDFVADIAFINCLYNIITNFNPSRAQTLSFNIQDIDGKPCVTQVFFNTSETDEEYSELVIACSGEISLESFAPFYSYLKWFEHTDNNSDWLFNGIETIVAFFKFLIGIIFSLFCIIFSVVGYIWQIVQCLLYLVGLTSKIYSFDSIVPLGLETETLFFFFYPSILN